MIHRSAGEERHAGALDHAKGLSAGRAPDVSPVRRTRVQLVLAALLVGLLGAFVLVNLGAVVEPRVNFVIASVEHPGLPVVVIVATCVGAAAGLLLRGGFSTKRETTSDRLPVTTLPRAVVVHPGPALPAAAPSA